MSVLKKVILKGIVISDKMNKTILVRIERKVRHKKYKKIVRRYTKYFVHDECNKCKVGDIVTFKEVAPISKNKNWILI